MAYNSGSTITCVVHGDDSPYKDAHHDPNIKLKFTATISRSGNNVKVTLSGMKFWVSGPGGYGYKMSVYARATAGSTTSKAWTKLDKSTCTKNEKWTRHPGAVTLTCYDNLTTTVYVQIGAYASDKKNCYHGETKRIAGYAFKAPPPNYTVKYDANGGENPPKDQIVPYASPTMTFQGSMVEPKSPIYPVDVQYNDYLTDSFVLVDSTTTYRAFTGWIAPDSNIYQIGDTYTVSANCTMYADWNTAPFTCRKPTPKYYTVTFVPNNGASSIPKDLERQSTYNTETDGTGTTYVPNNSYNIIVDKYLALYSIYGAVHLRPSDLPSVVNPGFVFDCWCTDSQLTTPVVFNEQGYFVVNRSLSLYARWIPLPIYQKDQNEWKSINPYVWKCVEENGVKKWKQIAHICKCVTEDGVKKWKDISEQQRSE